MLSDLHALFKTLGEGFGVMSRQLYNTVQFTQRQGFFYGWGTQSQAKLDIMFKSNSNYGAMPAKVAQLVLKQNADAWNAYFKAIETYKLDPKKFTGRPKPPSYIDDKNIVKFNANNYLWYCF